MKLSIFAIDQPVPPNSGARIDIYRRLKALKADGFKIQLFVWTPSPTPNTPFTLDGICDEVICLTLRADFSASSSTSKVHKLRVAALKLFSFVPAICQAMTLSAHDLGNVSKCLEAFAPDAVMIDGIQCAHAGFQAIKKWKRAVPLLYRSHNLESKYNYDLARNHKSWNKKLQYYCDAFRLLYYEPYIFLRTSATLQISYQDFLFWNRLKLGRQIWLRPIAEATLNRVLVKPVYDIVILGGWAESQKAAGLLWFLKQVKPLLPPYLTVTVAGRGASAELQEECRQNGCLFLGEVADAHEVLSKGAVLINAVFGGSGFYMKMLDLIRAGRPVVSTPDGITGMDLVPSQLVRLASTPCTFAQAIMDALASPINQDEAIAAYLSKYSAKECTQLFHKIMIDCTAAQGTLTN